MVSSLIIWQRFARQAVQQSTIGKLPFLLSYSPNSEVLIGYISSKKKMKLQALLLAWPTLINTQYNSRLRVASQSCQPKVGHIPRLTKTRLISTAKVKILCDF